MCAGLQEAGGKVKYVGGSSYLDRIPATFKFADLSHRLAEKANGAVLVRYLVPGEVLDEDELVSIHDDLDIQASHRPSRQHSPSKRSTYQHSLLGAS